MNERLRLGLERLRPTRDILNPGRFRDALGGTWRVVSGEKTSAAILGVLFAGSTYMGFSEMGSWQMAFDHLRAVQPNLWWPEATLKLAFDSADPIVDMVRRGPLRAIGLETFMTWGELASYGVSMPPGVDNDSFVMTPNRVRQELLGQTLTRVPVIISGVTAIAGAFMARRLLSRRGSESEYTPEYAQIQRRYDLGDSAMIGQVEALLANNPTEKYEMKQTYFNSVRCEEVIAQLFKGTDRNQRKEALNSIGLNAGDEILAKEFRVVTIDGSPSIVLRIKRGGEVIFGKETFYADQGYPPVLGVALSILAPHTEVTTVKIRTIIERGVPYTDPKTGKPGKTKAILNYDQYPNPIDLSEISHTRVEMVVPALAGVEPENAFPDFSQVLTHLSESTLNDRQIGIVLKQGKV